MRAEKEKRHRIAEECEDEKDLSVRTYIIIIIAFNCFHAVSFKSCFANPLKAGERPLQARQSNCWRGGACQGNEEEALHKITQRQEVVENLVSLTLLFAVS